MNIDITHIYRSLVVHRIDKNKFISLHYILSASEGYSLIDASLRTLLLLTRRTFRSSQDIEHAPSIENCGAVVARKSLDNSTYGEVEFAIPIKYIDESDLINNIYLLATSASEYGYCKDVWLMDIEIPHELLKNISGPNYGINGIRTKLNIFERPIVAISLQKIYIGSTLNDLKKFIETCIEGEIDLIVDDIFGFNNKEKFSIYDKCKLISEIVNTHNSVSKKKVGYFCYLNSFGKSFEETIFAVKEFNILGIIVNPFLMSYGFLNSHLKINFEENNQPVMICTNMGSSMIGRNPLDENLSSSTEDIELSRTGVSEVITAKLSRFIGADAIHIGTAGAECWHPTEFNMTPKVLTEDFHHIKPSMSIAEGDLPISELGSNLHYLGNDVIFEISSGIGLHSLGIHSGCQAYKLAIEFLDKDMTEKEYEATLLYLNRKFSCVKEALKSENWKPKKIEIGHAKQILLDSKWAERFK